MFDTQDVDAQGHHTEMIGEVDPVDHHRRQIQTGEVGGQQLGQSSLGGPHEPAGHRRTRRSRACTASPTGSRPADQRRQDTLANSFSIVNASSRSVAVKCSHTPAGSPLRRHRLGEPEGDARAPCGLPAPPTPARCRAGPRCAAGRVGPWGPRWRRAVRPAPRPALATPTPPPRPASLPEAEQPAQPAPAAANRRTGQRLPRQHRVHRDDLHQVVPFLVGVLGGAPDTFQPAGLRRGTTTWAVADVQSPADIDRIEATAPVNWRYVVGASASPRSALVSAVQIGIALALRTPVPTARRSRRRQTPQPLHRAHPAIRPLTVRVDARRPRRSSRQRLTPQPGATVPNR